MSGRLAIAIDLGGTQLRAAVVDERGAVLARANTKTQSSANPSEIVNQICEVAVSVASGFDKTSISAAGICSPGPLDSLTGTIIAVPTMPSWRDVPVRSILSDRLGLPVVLENDAIAATNGEWLFGAGRGLQNLVYVTVSTGIGGGAVVDGRLLRGRRGMAGHVGHMIIVQDGPLCSCGAQGCFEALASGTALAARGQQAVQETPSSLLAAEPSAGITARSIAEAARKGDPLALDLMGRQARILGIGFASLVHLFSPDVVVMGGGVSLAFDLLERHLTETVRETVMAPFRTVRVVPAALGDNAGIAGVAALALDSTREPTRLKAGK